MFELLKRIDRARFDVTCCFYSDYRRGEGGRRLSTELADLSIPFVLLPRPKQPTWAKLAKELGRALLPTTGLRRRWTHLVDARWRIAPQARTLARLLREGSFHLLYMNNQPSTNLEGYWAAQQAGVPVIQHCRIETRLLPSEIATVNRAAARVICVSQGVADDLGRQGVTRDLLTVVYNGIDVAQPLPRPLRADVPGLQIGTVGQLVPRKRFDDLLRAVAKLRTLGLDVACVIVGEGPEKERLEQLAHRLGIAPHVRLVGFQQQPLAWIQGFDIFVLPSEREGLPRVVLEAMLAGKPVIGADVTGTRELVTDGETGFLYPCKDVDALAERLRRLAEDRDLRQRMGEAGRRRVAEHFSIDRYVAGVTAVWEKVLQS